MGLLSKRRMNIILNKQHYENLILKLQSRLDLVTSANERLVKVASDARDARDEANANVDRLSIELESANATINDFREQLAAAKKKPAPRRASAPRKKKIEGEDK